MREDGGFERGFAPGLEAARCSTMLRIDAAAQMALATDRSAFVLRIVQRMGLGG